jgi:hypothetical protein
MFAFVGRLQYFDQGSSFCLFFTRDDCGYNGPSFFATVFNSAFAFNGDLSLWDVAKVTTMDLSKSMCIVENGLN